MQLAQLQLRSCRCEEAIIIIQDIDETFSDSRTQLLHTISKFYIIYIPVSPLSWPHADSDHPQLGTVFRREGKIDWQRHVADGEVEMRRTESVSRTGWMILLIGVWEWRFHRFRSGIDGIRSGIKIMWRKEACFVIFSKRMLFFDRQRHSGA